MQTETQQWQIDGAQQRYVNAMLAQAGMVPQWHYAGQGSYVLVIVVPQGFDLPTFLDDQRQAPRRRSWWSRMDIGRWVPVVLIVAVIAAVAYLLAYGAPAAIADVMPQIHMPVVELPTITMPGIEMPDVGGAVEGAINSAMAPVQSAINGIIQVVAGVLMLAVGLVVLWLLFTFRGTLSGIGGGIWKAGSSVAGKVAKRGGKHA